MRHHCDVLAGQADQLRSWEQSRELSRCAIAGARFTSDRVRFAVQRAVQQAGVTLHQVSVFLRRDRPYPVTLLVMEINAVFWHLLVFDSLDDVDVEAVTVGFGTVDVVARRRRPTNWASGQGR